MTKPLTVFWLVKTTPEWLALPPLGAGGRFDFLETTVKPILVRSPQVALRFFDAEAYNADCSDVLMWTVHERAQYDVLVDALRETPFWDRYFQVKAILPSLENQYADHYRQTPVQSGAAASA